MIRAIFFLIVCLALSAGLVLFITDLPKLATQDKKTIYKVLVIVALAIVLFVTFAYLLQIDNGHQGVLK